VTEATVYKVGVEIALMGGIAQGLSGVIGQLIGIEGKVGKINRELGGWGPTLVAVAGVAGLGLFATGLEKVFEQTKKLSDELAKVKQLGAGPEELAKLHKAAVDITRTVPGTTEAGVTETYREIRSLFGPGEEGAAEARKVLGPLSQLAQTMGGVSGNYEKAQGDLRSMLKSADILGYLTDPKTQQVDVNRLMEFLNVANKAYIGTGGVVDPATWLAMAKQGGISLRGLDPNGLMQMAMFAQIMGGARSGTAMMSLFQQMAGGTMFKRTAEAMQDIGLLKKGEWSTSGGRVVISDEASKRLTEMFSKSPLEGIKDLQEVMARNGMTNPNDQMREIFRILGRATTQRFVGEGLTNYSQMIREGEQLSNAQNIGEAQHTANITSLTAALHNIDAAFAELYQTIGGPNSDLLVAGINKVTGVVRGVTELARAISNSGLEEVLAKIATMGASFAGVLDVINALDWLGKQGPALDAAASAIRGAIGALESGAASLWNKLKGWWNGGSLNGGGTFAPNSDGGSMIHKESFVMPSGDKKPIITTTSLNIDGRKLAQDISQHLAELMEFPNQAPYGDETASYRSPDNQISDT
jgi:hypothetical protein